MKKETNLLELIHSDVCDSNDVLTHDGKIYFITFIDDFSKYCYVYIINHKHEIFDKFKIYKSELENQLERKIRLLRSNKVIRSYPGKSTIIYKFEYSRGNIKINQ